MADSLHICRSGSWRYADGVEVPVRIVAFEWQLLNDLGSDDGEEDEDPLPAREGLAYGLQVGHLPQFGHPVVYANAIDEGLQGAFARTARLLEFDRFAMSGPMHMTEREAIAEAEALLGAGLRWARIADPAP